VLSRWRGEKKRKKSDHIGNPVENLENVKPVTVPRQREGRKKEEKSLRHPVLKKEEKGEERYVVIRSGPEPGQALRLLQEEKKRGEVESWTFPMKKGGREKKKKRKGGDLGARIGELLEGKRRLYPLSGATHFEGGKRGGGREVPRIALEEGKERKDRRDSMRAPV